MTLVKSAPADFTLEELLAFLGQTEELDGRFRTTGEWCVHYKVSRVRMMLYMRRAKQLGVLRFERQPREALDGSMHLVQAYAFDVEPTQVE